MHSKEAIYNAEIAPALQKLSERCKELGMPFLALAQYAPASIGETCFLPPDTSYSLMLTWMMAHAHGNVDTFLFGLVRYLERNGMTTGGSPWWEITD